MSAKNNQAITHFAKRPGGFPFCKSRTALICTTEEKAAGTNWRICQRCAAKAAKKAA